MAKKRTIVPFYSKMAQSLEALSVRAFRSGDREAAKHFRDGAERSVNTRREACMERQLHKGGTRPLSKYHPAHPKYVGNAINREHISLKQKFA